ncbi:hypothetical protein HZS_3764, partial [Henneguya salminicola]
MWVDVTRTLDRFPRQRIYGYDSKSEILMPIILEFIVLGTPNVSDSLLSYIDIGSFNHNHLTCQNDISNLEVVDLQFKNSSSYKLCENMKKYLCIREERDQSKHILNEYNEIKNYSLLFPQQLKIYHDFLKEISCHTSEIQKNSTKIINHLNAIINRLKTENFFGLNSEFHDMLKTIFENYNKVIELSHQLNDGNSLIEDTNNLKSRLVKIKLQYTKEEQLIQIGNILSKLE